MTTEEFFKKGFELSEKRKEILDVIAKIETGGYVFISACERPTTGMGSTRRVDIPYIDSKGIILSKLREKLSEIEKEAEELKNNANGL